MERARDARASITRLYTMNAIGKPCCACRASWQLEAPLFLHLATLQAGARDTHHTSIEQHSSGPVPVRGRLARRVA